MNRLRCVLAMLLLAASGLVPAADPILRDPNGAVHTLHEYTGGGKWTVVMMWASDCHVCNEEAHAYSDFHRRHRETDAVMLGLSLDGWERRDAAGDFIRRHALAFPNLIVEPDGGAALYASLTGRPWIGTPTFLVYGPDGTLLAQVVGAVPVEIIEGFMREQAAAGNG
jgi:thiol-disulfide isomerase/thioredoxin